MSKKASWVAIVLGLALGGVAVAQVQSMPGRKPMGPDMMRGGPGMMGMGCPMMMPDAQVTVKQVENGISITITSSDPKVASRIQKRGEIMRLMHELHEEEMSD